MANQLTQAVIANQDGTNNMAEIIELSDNLVAKIVYSRWGHSEDLIQEGRIAVMLAVDKFDRGKGEFSTLAFHAITAAVNQAGPESMHVGAIVPWGTLKKYRRAMRHANGDVELALSVCGDFGMSAATFVEVVQAIGPQQIEHDDVLAREEPEAHLSDMAISEFLDALGGDKTTFCMYYGIEDGQPRSAAELAKLRGCTESQIVTIIRRSRRRLRASMKND